MGHAVRGSSEGRPVPGLNLDGDERRSLTELTQSPGFQFTVGVQRSWSKGRASRAAWLTLSVLAENHRQQLLNEWISTGGGTASFFNLEADRFLEFIAGQLMDPSVELTICRLEQATFRARDGADQFKAPDLSRWESEESVVARGRYASLVSFHADPFLLLAALNGGALPPISPNAKMILFGSGLEGFFREATEEEAGLWKRLTEPLGSIRLIEEGYQRNTIEALILAGCVEINNKIPHG